MILALVPPNHEEAKSTDPRLSAEDSEAQDISSDETSFHTNVMSSPSLELTDSMDTLMEREILSFRDNYLNNFHFYQERKPKKGDFVYYYDSDWEEWFKV